MAKIKSISLKNQDGTFSSPSEIGVDGKNVDLEEGMTLEEKLPDLAPKNHKSPTKEYGIASEDDYGHVRISNKYDDPTDDPDNTAISQTGMLELLTDLQRLLKFIQVLDEDQDEAILYSALNVGYLYDEKTMRLLTEYFEVIDDPSAPGEQILVVK